MTQPHERIITALDVHSVDAAHVLCSQLNGRVGSYKVGLELIYSVLASVLMEQGTKEVGAARELFRNHGHQMFLDGKFHDIPNTVAGAVSAACHLGIRMVNTHCTGGHSMQRAAIEAAKAYEGEHGSRPLMLGVTLLTSLDFDDLASMGFMDLQFSELAQAQDAIEVDEIKSRSVKSVVRKLAVLAKESGLDGVISSPQEIRIIREACGDDFLIVTPGVRPAWAAANDQKRVMTPGEAIRAGADYLVIGRPITKPPSEIGSPVNAAERIAEEIAEARKEVA